jgi:MFS family permease
VNLFVIGGMIGALVSKYMSDKFGRKGSIVLHFLFSIIAGGLTLIGYHVNSPLLVMSSRFFMGLQGGMSCCLVPPYLAEISPNNLRGRTGVMQQLAITLGILAGQIFGWNQLFGKRYLWHVLLAIPMIPSFIGLVCLIVFFYETPNILYSKKKNIEAARLALQYLRNDLDVEDELEELRYEANKGQNDQNISIVELFTMNSLRIPIIICLILQFIQQFSGVNAIFFYCASIFSKAGVSGDYIQYAVASVGVVNVLSTFICIALIDRLGRKPLLTVPMLIIVVDFVIITVFLVYKVIKLFEF